MQPDFMQDAVALLRDLVKIPSHSSKEDQAANFLQTRLNEYFPGQVTRSGHSLIIDIKGAANGPTLLLCSHIDTVAVAAGWTRDPFGGAMEGDKLYGLGANDAGASVVSMIAAARASLPLKAGRLLVCLAAEEEAGEQGFMRVEPSLPAYDAAIFGEPTNMGVATEMRGSMRAIVRSRGISCHASRPWEGKNASDKLIVDLQAIRKIALMDDSPWKCATIEPTVIRGGESTNQIPALIETTLDIRTTPEKNNDWIIAQLQATGAEIEMVVNRRRPMHNPADAPLVKAIKSLTPAVATYAFNGSCDMAFSRAPSVVMGPGQSVRSHAADEYITISEIAQGVDIYTRTIAGYLGG